MKYFVTVAGREFVVELDGDHTIVDGVASAVHRAAVPGTPMQQLLVDGRAVVLAVQPAGRGRWVADAGGARHEAEVVDERTRHVQQLVGAGRKTGGGTLKAPMPGLVVRVLAEVGQAVAAGQGLVVLEAMKMENELKAAGPGVVTAILAIPGAAVEKGQALLELGEPGSSHT
jgi:pyruvate carboxylase subunit B